MKTIKLNFGLLLVLFSSTLFMASCTKTVEKGNLKVVVHYTGHTSGDLTYTMKDKPKVEVSKAGVVVATQYANGSDAIDFGSYEYGAYNVKVTGTEMYVNTKTGATGDGAFYTKGNDFNIDAATKTVTVEIP